MATPATTERVLAPIRDAPGRPARPLSLAVVQTRIVFAVQLSRVAAYAYPEARPALVLLLVAAALIVEPMHSACLAVVAANRSACQSHWQRSARPVRHRPRLLPCPAIHRQRAALRLAIARQQVVGSHKISLIWGLLRSSLGWLLQPRSR
jgi:hypothetical protein